VYNREKTKSLLVKCLDHFKELYMHLGDKLVKELLIPDAQLIFFFTHTEIGHIVDQDDSCTEIIAKLV